MFHHDSYIRTMNLLVDKRRANTILIMKFNWPIKFRNVQIERKIPDKHFILMAVELYRARKYSMEVAYETSIRADLVGGWNMGYVI